MSTLAIAFNGLLKNAPPSVPALISLLASVLTTFAVCAVAFSLVYVITPVPVSWAKFVTTFVAGSPGAPAGVKLI